MLRGVQWGGFTRGGWWETLTFEGQDASCKQGRGVASALAQG